LILLTSPESPCIFIIMFLKTALMISMNFGV
jgi:hypothetical protein